VKRLVLFILVIFILAGCQKSALAKTEAEDILNIVEMQNYLAKEIGETSFGGVAFCAYDVLQAERDAQNINIYLWVVCQEYYQNDQGLERGTGVSLPVAVYLGNENETYSILDHRASEGFGEELAQEYKDIFPRSVRKKMENNTVEEINEYNLRIGKLNKINEENAQEYFNVKN